MKPPPFDYYAPAGLAEATRLLADLDGAKVLAGGQSLMPMLNLRLARPDALVDINNVAGLTSVDWGARAGHVRVGAMVRQRAAERDSELTTRFPLLGEALGNVGHFQTRNRGTVGGSIAHLDPAAELVAVASATDATVILESVRGTREVPFRDFPLGPMMPDIEPDEILVGVDFALWAPGHGYAFLEFARRHGDFAIVAVAVLVELDHDGLVARSSVAVLGLEQVVTRAHDVEQAILGQALDSETVVRAVAALGEPDDADRERPDEAYRRRLAHHLTRQALLLAGERATSGTSET